MASGQTDSNQRVIIAMLASIDAGEFTAATDHFTDDITIILGNSEPLVGVFAFIRRSKEFTGSFQSVRHEIHHVWPAANDVDVVVATMTAHYTRRDGLQLGVPGCNVFRMDKVVDGEVAALEITADRLTGVQLASGRVVPVQALATMPYLTARSEVLTKLDLTAVAASHRHGHAPRVRRHRAEHRCGGVGGR